MNEKINGHKAVDEKNDDSKSKKNDNDILNSLKAGVSSDLSSLDKELDSMNEKDGQILKLTEEVKDLKDKFLRSVAEVDNTRRIAREEKEKALKYGISNFANDLIPVMENFFLAFENVKKEKVDKTFFEGIMLTFNEFKKVFEKNGIKRSFPLNEEFDPKLHQAIAQVDGGEDENIIVNVMQAGYIIGDRVLKPAMVAVSKGKK